MPPSVRLDMSKVPPASMMKQALPPVLDPVKEVVPGPLVVNRGAIGGARIVERQSEIIVMIALVHVEADDGATRAHIRRQSGKRFGQPLNIPVA